MKNEPMICFVANKIILSGQLVSQEGGSYLCSIGRLDLAL